MKYIKTILLILLLPTLAWAASQQTSSTLASTIITNARYYLNESSAVMWSDAELLVHVNSGTMDIVTRTHCLDGSENEPLSVGQSNYALTDDYLFIYAVVLDDEKGLLHGNLQSIGHLRSEGEPAYWCQSGDKVIVYPTPDSAGSSIDVYTVTRPASVASSAAVLVPACYDRALTLYVAAQAFYKDGKFAKAGRLMAEYLAELDRFRSDFVVIPKEPIDIIR